MAVTETPGCDFGSPAPEFNLPGVDDRNWSLADCRGARGTLVMFICNHCPFVKAVQDKLVRDARDLAALGVTSVAIMPNDFVKYPEDSFANMKRVAERLHYPFPYLLDESQAVARAYGAVCTPDFFGFNAGLELQYRGRMDSTSPGRPGPPDVQRELFEAMRQVAETGKAPAKQIPSMGCSIKWRD
ncbi:MAG: thioredoxin family protein [Gammaproteobacteria bacterium]|nr:thioredoxin family protein [Gammaproteobacteria bacterium]